MQCLGYTALRHGFSVNAPTEFAPYQGIRARTQADVSDRLSLENGGVILCHRRILMIDSEPKLRRRPSITSGVTYSSKQLIGTVRLPKTSGSRAPVLLVLPQKCIWRGNRAAGDRCRDRQPHPRLSQYTTARLLLFFTSGTPPPSFLYACGGVHLRIKFKVVPPLHRIYVSHGSYRNAIGINCMGFSANRLGVTIGDLVFVVARWLSVNRRSSVTPLKIGWSIG